MRAPPIGRSLGTVVKGAGFLVPPQGRFFLKPTLPDSLSSCETLAAKGFLMHDLVIRGGTVIDGNGSGPREADVAIEGDKIVAVGEEVGVHVSAAPSHCSWPKPASRIRWPRTINRAL